MAVRVDLHTHSEASKDGGITPEQYAELLKNERLDVIAITDHNRVDFALGMQKALGKDKIIVGEEIMTTQGEITGLYLTKKIDSGMSAQETIDAIKAQNGLVYIPHPFETVRHGIQEEVLNALARDVDIIEGCNGRAFFQKRGPQAVTWARQHGIAVAASSDAHGRKGMGHTYTSLQKRPTRATLVSQLQKAQLACGRPPFYTLLYPKINRFKKLLRGQG